MTTNDQIAVLAELDEPDVEWRLDKLTDRIVTGYYCDSTRREAKNYLNSYDVIIPLIQKQPDRIKEKMDFLLVEHTSFMIFATEIFDETPAELSGALIRAHGKWKD